MPMPQRPRRLASPSQLGHQAQTGWGCSQHATHMSLQGTPAAMSGSRVTTAGKVAADEQPSQVGCALSTDAVDVVDAVAAPARASASARVAIMMPIVRRAMLQHCENEYLQHST